MYLWQRGGKSPVTPGTCQEWSYNMELIQFAIWCVCGVCESVRVCVCVGGVEVCVT